MKSYTAKSSAVRAAKKAHGADWAELYEAVPYCKNGLDLFRVVAKKVVAAKKPIEEVNADLEKLIKEADVLTAKVEATGLKVAKPKTRVIDEAAVLGSTQPRKSSIERPCMEVWNIAEVCKQQAIDEGTKLSRKAVIALCIGSGIAKYTARTQYQLWYAASKETLKAHGLIK